MQKNIILIVCFISAISSIFAQTVEKTDSSNNYSESVPYKPREFQEKNSDKKKKPKKQDQKTNLVTVPETIENITIPVTVFDEKGKAVSNLEKKDFRAFVDDKEVDDFEFEQPDQSLDLILLIDTSASTTFKAEDLQNFSLAFAEKLKPQDRILIADFNERLKIRTPLTNDRETIKKAIDKVEGGDGTALYDSIHEIFSKQGTPLRKRSAIILLTDGVDTVSQKTSYQKSLETAEKYGIPVYVVYLDTYQDASQATVKAQNNLKRLGINPQSLGATQSEYELGKLYLNDLLRLSGGRAAVFEIDSVTKKAVLPNFDAELRQKYYLTFKSPESTQKGERRQLKIRVSRPNLSIYAKGSYILK